MKNVICLLIDRFHLGFLGAYGNAEIETPAINRLAAESLTADRFYIDTLDVGEACRSWWFGTHALCREEIANTPPQSFISQLNANGYKTVLLTDNLNVAYSVHAEDFSEMRLLPITKNLAPCQNLEQTHLFSMFAAIADAAETLADSEKPYFLWCRLCGFAENWDVPMVYRDKYCGRGDPAPYNQVTPPPFLRKNDQYDEQRWDDLRQSVAASYAGGVTMLDELMESLTEMLRAGDFGEETLFLFAGTSGILLGEENCIGIPLKQWYPNQPFESAEQFAIFHHEPLVSALIQTPLMIRFPDQFGAATRTDALLQPGDMTQLFCEWFNELSPMSELLSLISGKTDSHHDCLLIVADAESYKEQSCFVTPAWLLRKNSSSHPNAETSSDPSYALFAKPDDRWDVNNVADRCDEIVEQLRDVQKRLQERLLSLSITVGISPSALLRQPLPKILRERYQ
ncbi:MAG: sulfatase-like hydrolase/transferase [Planctomycetaceae bacterium]|nr:sulfatase-like hydrolase/transferase [Planctomycetaceae bacterium]